MRAALNEIAAAAPEWLATAAQPEWFVRYAARAEQSRMPRTDPAREEYARQVGRDGFHLLKLLGEEQPDLLKLAQVETLEKVWQRHYTRQEDGEVNRAGKRQFSKGGNCHRIAL